MRRLFIFLCLILFFCGNSFAEEIRTAIRLYIGGFDGPNYVVQVNGNVVKYEVTGMTGGDKKPTETFNVSTQKIQDFINKLKTLGIQEWRGDYSNISLVDGTHWSVMIKHKDLSMSSQGSNNFPDNFQSYLEAVKTLIDQRNFS